MLLLAPCSFIFSVLLTQAAWLWPAARDSATQVWLGAVTSTTTTSLTVASAQFEATATVDSSPNPATSSTTRKKPNIFFVLVDDLGWGNVDFTEALFPVKTAEFYRPEASIGSLEHIAQRQKELRKSSSFLSSLAKQGRVLLRHYVHNTCSPSRSSLQTGRLPVHVQTQLLNPCHPGAGAPKEMTGIAERMKLANYSTHFVGKWDAGMAYRKQIPTGKGYDTSLNYFSHGNWMWTEDVWVGSLVNSSRPPKCVMELGCAKDLWDSDRPARKLNGTLYEEALFKNRLLEIIYREADNPGQPLFLMYHPRVAHYPLQAPRAYQREFGFVLDSAHRRVYLSMVAYLDGVLEKVVGALKDTGRWDNTLMIFTSDNGGVTKTPARCVEATRGLACFNGEAGANNFPLRGGKYTNWEGGIRVATFISGGYVKPELRGTRVNGIMHIADWYATLQYVGGVVEGKNETWVDEPARKAGLPPHDSLNQFDLLFGKKPPARPIRDTVLLSKTAMVKGRFKLLTGIQFGADWGGFLYPNLTTRDKHRAVYDTTILCRPACLYDLDDDPLEHNNLAPVQPELVSELLAELQELGKSVWVRPRSNADPQCFITAKQRWGGFLGWWKDG